MKVSYCEQGSGEWLQMRIGKVTASRVAAAMSFLQRGGESKARADLKRELAAEIITGTVDPHGYVSSYMKDGTAAEPYARAAYEVEYDVSVDVVGFIFHPTIERAGASPDGLVVGGKGGLEIKAPKTTTHIEYLEANILPPDYEPQVMFNLACSEYEWWDFVSWDDRMTSQFKLFRKRVYRDEKRIAEINAGVTQFLREVDEKIEHLRKLYPAKERVPIVQSIEDESLGVQDADIQSWWNSQEGK